MGRYFVTGATGFLGGELTKQLISRGHQVVALVRDPARASILKTLGGVRNMGDLPGLVFIVDTKKEQNAVNEARRLRIPIVGVVDSNADPGEVDYPVPGNDDAMRAIGLFARVVADACIDGRARFTEGRDVSSGDAEAPESAKSVA